MADKITTFVTPVRRYHPRWILSTRDTNSNTFQPPADEGGNQFRQTPLDIVTRATHNGGGTRAIPDLTF